MSISAYKRSKTEFIRRKILCAGSRECSRNYLRPPASKKYFNKKEKAGNGKRIPAFSDNQDRLPERGKHCFRVFWQSDCQSGRAEKIKRREFTERSYISLKGFSPS